MKIINLLPKEKQKELTYRRILRVVIYLILISGFSFALVLLLQFGMKEFLLGQEARLNLSIENLKEQVGKEENAVLKNRIQSLNNLTSDYKTLSSNLPKSSKIIRAFAPLMPSGIKITNMKIDIVRKTVEINGFSQSREQVIKLYDNIAAANKDFPNIDYPLENVAKPLNINFHFTFNFSDSVIQ